MDSESGGLIVAIILLVLTGLIFTGVLLDERIDKLEQLNAIEHIEQQTGHTQ